MGQHRDARGYAGRARATAASCRDAAGPSRRPRRAGPRAHGAARPRRRCARPRRGWASTTGARVGGDARGGAGLCSTPTGRRRRRPPHRRRRRGRLDPPAGGHLRRAPSWSRPLADAARLRPRQRGRRSGRGPRPAAPPPTAARPARSEHALRLRRGYAALVAQQHAPAAALRCVPCGAVTRRAAVDEPPRSATPADPHALASFDRHRRARRRVESATALRESENDAFAATFGGPRRPGARLGRGGRADAASGRARRARGREPPRRSRTRRDSAAPRARRHYERRMPGIW